MPDFKFEEDGSFEYLGTQHQYIYHKAGSENIVLDGTFTIAELESVVYMAKNARPKEKGNNK